MKANPPEKQGVVVRAWQLAVPYWRSDEKASAWLLLLTVIALNLGHIYIRVRLNGWNNAFYNALQSLDQDAFFHQLGIFCVLAGLGLVMSVYAYYLSQVLQIRWRRWLTRHFVASWLADRAYHHLQLAGGTDNPDQRISEDLNQFTSYALTLSLGLLTSVVSLCSFLTILWQLSGPGEILLGRWGALHLPGYLVWTALLFAGVGTCLTLVLGRPLVPLNFNAQRLEADFRFSLVRLRENSESVAFFGGEPIERALLFRRFDQVFRNFWQLMKRQKQLAWLTSGYAQVAVIVPVIAIAPRYFARQISLGGLMQAVSAFSSVQSSLSFVVTSYADLAAFAAITQRLSGFAEHLRALHQAAEIPTEIAIRRHGRGLAVKGLDLDLPNGRVLLRNVAFTVTAGESLLIIGPTGTGKSTILRALAGLWPAGRGEIRLDAGSMLFLPQRPYLPISTLAEALLYPRELEACLPRTRLVEALEQVGLSDLGDELDTVQNWPQRLSLGEQQRLVFARVLLIMPGLLILDEATSALDEAWEARLYGLLRPASWELTFVSVGHRSSLRRFHDCVLDAASFSVPARPAAVKAAEPPPTLPVPGVATCMGSAS
ncbi:MAG TPA: ABC transporter ATP-binding protein/permease [Chthoniobacterales bacterium]